MAQKAAKAKKLVDISGEKFEAMEPAEILESINLDPAKHKGLRVYKKKIYIGGAHGLNYGEEITAFQVLYNKMIDGGMITGKKIKEDGKYGDETSAAIFNLQRQINANTGMRIHEDGYFGSETWAGTQALLEGKMGYVPKKAPGVEEKTLEDFSAGAKKITKKSSPNEKFEWDVAYSESLDERGIVEKDDYGNYQLSEDAMAYLEEYNKGQKKEWKVTESSLEEAINEPSKFKNKHAKAIEYIIDKYEAEARVPVPPGGGLPGAGEGRGEEFAPPVYTKEELIPLEIYAQLTPDEKAKADKIADIIESEMDPEAKKKMLIALRKLKTAENPVDLVTYWLSKEDLKKTLINEGSKLG